MSQDDFIDLNTMGGRIRALRQAKGLSQRELAEKIKEVSGVPITKAAIRHWETGRAKNIKNVYMLALVEILQTDDHYLIYGPRRGPKKTRR